MCVYACVCCVCRLPCQVVQSQSCKDTRRPIPAGHCSATFGKCPLHCQCRSNIGLGATPRTFPVQRTTYHGVGGGGVASVVCIHQTCDVLHLVLFQHTRCSAMLFRVIHKGAFTQLHTCSHVHTHTYTHAHTQTHTHIHNRCLPFQHSWPRSRHQYCL
jgi:hypothetical protein